uniref:Putative DNA polymerase n=1 Tax=viral metagenome TaxID=1070528 RepID=A0A6M3IQC1_9ZZZZ
MSEVFYRKYRPRVFKNVIGQDKSLRMLRDMIKRDSIPHAILFSGPSGTGKTTLARIMCNKLQCDPVDVQEINTADFRGIDMIRDIRSRMHQAPLSGTCRAYIIDEAHKMSTDAQHAVLKILEDTPAHVYFFLATTEPNKLIKTVRNRCTEIALKSLSTNDLIEGVILPVVQKEELNLPQGIIEAVANAAEGSPRKALVILHQIIGLSNEKEMVDAIESVDSEKAGIDIARALLSGRTSWKAMTELLKAVNQEEPETIRRIVLGYASAVALSGGNMTGKAIQMIECFRDNYYDTGKAGLVLSCYELVQGK